ncbi:MAG TPA: D-alanine--D-alanine ligase [Bacteroidales bacterium]|nr:D-alanine--D-alanine ligase [Bacteroidales bacterium]
MRNIAIVAGGDSSEFEVSVRSADGVKDALSKLYNTYVIMIRGTNWFWEDQKGRYFNIDKNNFTLKVGDDIIRFDAVFIAIHGKPGENGLLQGYFDMLGIKYTTCGVFSSALTFNKQATKAFLKEYGIAMAEAEMIKKGEEINAKAILHKTGLPCFVKPNDSGSSVGVSKIKSESEFLPAVEKAFGESDTVMIESFMEGREVACGVVKSKNRKLVLPVTEIISKNEFFDYEAKYTPGRSEEVTPAKMDDKITEEIQRLSSVIYDLLDCRGIVRVDFIVVRNKPLFLEINTVPGMTEESLVPQQAKAAGISLTDFYSMVIEDLF